MDHSWEAKKTVTHEGQSQARTSRPNAEPSSVSTFAIITTIEIVIAMTTKMIIIIVISTRPDLFRPGQFGIITIEIIIKVSIAIIIVLQFQL